MEFPDFAGFFKRMQVVADGAAGAADGGGDLFLGDAGVFPDTEEDVFRNRRFYPFVCRGKYSNTKDTKEC